MSKVQETALGVILAGIGLAGLYFNIDWSGPILFIAIFMII